MVHGWTIFIYVTVGDAKWKREGGLNTFRGGFLSEPGYSFTRYTIVHTSVASGTNSISQPNLWK